MSDAPELLPCPACGVKLLEHYLRLDGDPYRLFQHGGTKIQCHMAHVTVISLRNGSYPKRRDIAYDFLMEEQWNTRAPDAPIMAHPKVKALVEALVRIEDLTQHNMAMTARDEQCVNREARKALAAIKDEGDEG